MLKSDLIAKMAAYYPQYSIAELTVAVNSIIEQMAATLAKHERVEIRGFGSFSLHLQPARQAHNPKTQKKITTPIKYRPHFKPGKTLRDRVNLLPPIPD